MSYQAVLPILPLAPPLGRPNPDAEALRSRAGVEYHEIGVRDILNRSTSSKLPFQWTINPYRGCEFACTYCYARDTHGFLDLHRWQDFERRIFVKRGADRALRRQLRKGDLRGQAIAIGTATDPYQPAEHHYRVTRSLLKVFLEFQGLDLSITTKSPLVARDLELLMELDRRHVVSVNMTVTTADPSLARRIELHAPDARARLRTVKRLSEQGVATNIFCMPLMPGINDGEETLRPLMEAAREAGATDVLAAPLYFKPKARARFLGWLEEEFPRLVPQYRRLYGWRDHLKDSQKDLIKAPFRRLRLEYGFPRVAPGRG